MGTTALKIASLVVSVVGIGVSFAQTIIGNKQMKMDIAEEVAEAMKNYQK